MEIYCGCGMDIEHKAISYWQDKLAKFFPKSKGPTNTEIDMFRAGYIQAEAELRDMQAYIEYSVERHLKLCEVLQLIATPQRPDGTWNRDRKACMELARDALKEFHISEDDASE